MTRLKRAEDPITRELLLRARGAAHALARGDVRRRRIFGDYLASTTDPRLHFGAGPVRLSGWLNTELIAGDGYMDLTRRLPLPDARFAYAFGERVVEHLSDVVGERLLRDLHRILRPGGVLCVTTPDLRQIIAIYEDRNPIVASTTTAGSWT